MGCCAKIPYRFWIGVMIFFTSYITSSLRAGLSISITAMVKKTRFTQTPECLQKLNKTVEGGSVNSSSDGTYGVLFDWDERIQGRILGGYFMGLFLGCIPCGMVVEWIGPFRPIFTAMLISALLNSLCVVGALFHWGIVMGCRFLMGLLTSCVYPGLHCLISRWSPPAEKGKFLAALLGNTLGTCVTWYTVAAITDAFNWYWGFHAVSIVVAIYLVPFWIVCYDYPDQCKWVTQEEVEYIKISQGGQLSKTKQTAPVKRILLSVPFWAISLSSFGNLWGLFLQLTEVPKFLIEVVGFNLKKSGLLSALPQLSRLICGIFFGFLGDFVVKREILSKMQVRKGFTLFSHIIPGILLMGISVVGCNPYGVIALLAVSLGINGASIVTYNQNMHDITPNFVATINSFSEVIASSSGFLSTLVTSFLIKNQNGMVQWGINFVIGGCIYCAGGIFFILLGSTEVQPWNEKKADQDQEPKET